MNVQLRPELAKFVDEQVQAGKFDSAEEVVNAAIARFQIEQQPAEQLSPEELAELRAEVAIGIEQADRGELAEWDADEIIAEMERRYNSEPHEKGR